MRLRSIILAAAGALTVTACLSTAEAHWDRPGWSAPRWEPRYEHHWRPYYAPPAYYAPRIHYAPPPVYYAPRPYYRPPGGYYGYGGG